MSRQARSLDVLVDEINTIAPNRLKISDGGLGDPRHAATVSDHNPNSAGVWRARDITDDDLDDNHDERPDDIFDCDWLAGVLVAMYHAADVHPAMRSGAYTIYKRRIYSYDRRAEGWRPYGGSSPHDHHLHQSVATDASGYDSTRPWNLKEIEDMPFTEQQLRAIVRDETAKVVAAALDAPLNVNDGPKADDAFRGWSVRKAIKAIARASGAVPKP